MLLLPACNWFGGAGTPAVPSVAPVGERPDIVLVTLDTTRADRIGAYGYKDAHTDAIDGIAAKGIRFDHATSPLPLTIPAHSTMFTGLYPHRHGVRSNGDNVLAKEHTTLAEVLGGAGWNTGASVAAFVTGRSWGLSQGFDAYFDQLPEEEPAAEGAAPDKNFWHDERSGDLVVDDALNWLAGQPAEKPVFLWVHLYDAHFPYLQHEGQGEVFKDRPYDGELAFMDDQIARIQGAFEGRQVLWVLVGDHGESLGEHGEMTHGLYTYEATQHVPFIVSGAGVTPGVVSEAVSTADVMPTILRAAGLPIPEGLDGKPQPGSPQVPYAESYQLAERLRMAPHRMVTDGKYKLIDVPRPELYDLAADPMETHDIAAEKPEEVARLRALLTEKAASPPTGERASLDAETVGQLAALGYVAGDTDDIDYTSLPDPKDFKEFLAKLNRLEYIQRTKGPEAAVAVLDELIAAKPDVFELRMRKLPLLGRLGRKEEARAFLQETSQLFADKARVWVTLAGMALKDQQIEEALVLGERGLAADPLDSASQEITIEALFRLQRAEEAVTKARAFMTANPTNYGVAALLGRHYLGARNFLEAERFLRIAVSGPNPRRAARAQLALLAVAAGARNDAFKLLESEVKDFPGSMLARRMLSRMYGEDQRWLDQKAHAEFIARAAPEDAIARLNVAQCLFNLTDFLGARKELTVALALGPKNPDVLLLHANLLAKEGKREEGAIVAAEAKRLHEVRLKEAQARGAKLVPNPAVAPPPGTPPAPATAPVAPAVVPPPTGNFPQAPK